MAADSWPMLTFSYYPLKSLIILTTLHFILILSQLIEQIQIIYGSYLSKTLADNNHDAQEKLRTWRTLRDFDSLVRNLPFLAYNMLYLLGSRRKKLIGTGGNL